MNLMVELLILILVFFALWGGLNFLVRHISPWATKPTRLEVSGTIALLLTLIIGIAKLAI